MKGASAIAIEIEGDGEDHANPQEKTDLIPSTLPAVAAAKVSKVDIYEQPTLILMSRGYCYYAIAVIITSIVLFAVSFGASTGAYSHVSFNSGTLPVNPNPYLHDVPFLSIITPLIKDQGFSYSYLASTTVSLQGSSYIFAAGLETVNSSSSISYDGENLSISIIPGTEIATLFKISTLASLGYASQVYAQFANDINSIAVDSTRGFVYVVDYPSSGTKTIHNISCWDQSITSSLAGSGAFYNPADISVDPVTGTVYVLDNSFVSSSPDYLFGGTDVVTTGKLFILQPGGSAFTAVTLTSVTNTVACDITNLAYSGIEIDGSRSAGYIINNNTVMSFSLSSITSSYTSSCQVIAGNTTSGYLDTYSYVSGNFVSFSSLTSTTAASTLWKNPSKFAIDYSSGSLIIPDSGNKVIRKVSNPNSNFPIISTLAGNEVSVNSSLNLPSFAQLATLNSDYSISIDISTGDIYLPSGSSLQKISYTY